MNMRTPSTPALFAADAVCEVDGTVAMRPTTGPICSGLQWHNQFAAMGSAFYTALQPASLPNPYWIGHSATVAAQLGLNPHWFASEEALQVFSGNTQLPGMQPLASVYSGHQFGVWAGQLGDGRAILLGETASGLELQLKGAGPTPYSRRGDGRAVLRSSIREFLASMAMQGLGIPTTQALCITGSHAAVQREETETAAVVTRVAPSFIRFGHFEHFAASGKLAELRQLADHVIDQNYPACRNTAQFNGNAYAALLAEVTLRTAALLAQWQAVGFCHGVMNTDNMSILGLTIDYGPFQFLDAFVPGHVCNHSDTQGRYAFNQQPQVAYWNLFCLGQALLPLIEDPALAMSALEPYRTAFAQNFEAAMRAKLGLAETQPDDTALIDDLLQLLANNAVDYPVFWRRLSDYMAGGPLEAVRDLMPDRGALDAWMLLYSARILHKDRQRSALLMLKTNPRFVLRNHLAEEAIAAAKTGDFSRVAALQQLLESPFDTHPGFEAEAGFPPDWASTIEISCSS